jgi:signal transduction histidine kinase
VKGLSIRTKLVLLFSALVAVPLVAAVAWLGVTAHRSVMNAGRELTGVADSSLQQAARDVARLTADNAEDSRDELVQIGRRSLTKFAEREIQVSQQTLQRSAKNLTRSGTGALQGATERIAVASAKAVSDANARLRKRQRQAVGEVSQALIRSSREAFDRVGRHLTAESETMVIDLARNLNRERSRRTRDLVLAFLQSSMDAVGQAAQEPRMLSEDRFVGGRLRQLGEKLRAGLLRAELLDENGVPIAQWPPPLSPVPVEPVKLPVIAARALQSERTELSEVEFVPEGAAPVVHVAAAVRAGPGRNAPPPGRRVLVATLSLDSLQLLLLRQALGGGQPAPLFVMTRQGQIVAHSDPTNVGRYLSLPGGLGPQQIEGDTVMFETPGGGPQRQLIARTDMRLPAWSVVAVQPLTALLAQTAELQQAIQRTAVAAANEMVKEAGTRTARLDAESVREQDRAAAEIAEQVRRENRAVAKAAVSGLVRQQAAIARGALARMRQDSQGASQEAEREMDRTARKIAGQSALRIAYEADRRAKLNLASMHELASRTAGTAAGNIVFEAVGILAVALMAALLVALLTARSAVRPITALAAGARSIALGDFSHRVPITAEDELGQLAASFNRMAASIEASRAELEASNRTLAQEKRRIQAIVDNSPDGLLILNDDGSVGYANPAARRMLPWRETPGANGAVALEEVLPPTLLRSLGDCLCRIDAGDASVCDVALEQPRRVLQMRSVPLESSSADIGRLVHLHDVTREREIDEMKSNFVMLVSHELRTPLTSILGFSSYMLLGKMGPLTEAQRGGLESIERQAHRLKAIATDFLDLSLIETGRLEIRREPVDVERVARRVLEELSPQARERGLWLRLAPGQHEIPAVLGDEARIAQIFTNLVHNAIKFTEQGGVEVALTRGPKEIRVEVRDTGIGIPEEVQARIFDRFYQVDEIVTRKAGGTGLGLSIVKELVQAHGGEVGVSSSPAGDGAGSGTTFYFTLPVAGKSSDVRRLASGV